MTKEFERYWDDCDRASPGPWEVVPDSDAENDFFWVVQSNNFQKPLELVAHLAEALPTLSCNTRHCLFDIVCVRVGGRVLGAALNPCSKRWGFPIPPSASVRHIYPLRTV